MADSSNNNQYSVIEKALKRFVDEYLRGEQPDTEEFVRQYPDCEDLLRQRIQNLLKINTLFDTLVQMDESDFEATATGLDLVDKKIGSFKIEEIIGRGGMGVVYLARDTKLDRSVAIKSIPASLAGDSTARMRFRREAKLLASLNHPNIAVIHEIIEQEEGASYLVLEYVPGQTLAQRIAHNKPLKLEEALSIAQQVAEAVSAAHEKGVVHRDLKPGNIKITPEGKLKVLDFGLAKTSTSEGRGSEITVTQPGHIMGTPAYMSPEQTRGKPTDKRSDIWSFGCIMYQMLTGKLPFEGETATDTLAQIIERQPDWEALPQDTPTNIRTLLRRCLEKKPQQRLRDIGDAVIEIKETLNIPVTAPPVTTSSSTSLKPQNANMHRLRTAAMIAAAFVIVLIIIVVQIVSKNEVQPSSKEIRLVVLPFENLGPTEDEYFADGITDAITARLSGIHGLAIISRQSAIQYKKTEKDTRQIAKELRVDYILEGTVQREQPSDPTSRVRIIPQLIRASEDTHVWTEIYDDDMSEVFRLQSDLAERVAQALDIAVIELERRALASRPTENMESYEYYLRGEEYRGRSHSESYFTENAFKIAIKMYERAVELDPGFALAYARLSEMHCHTYNFYYDKSDERLAMAKQAVDKAFQLDPDLPEAHYALGIYYHVQMDNDRALEQFEIVRKSQPNNGEAIAFTAFTQRNQGKLEQALTNLNKVMELNPLDLDRLIEAGNTCYYLHKYTEAERYYDQAILLAPDMSYPYYCKARLYLCSEGSTEKARAILSEAQPNVESKKDFFFTNLFFHLDVFDRNYQEALDQLSLISEDEDDFFHYIPNTLQYARIYMYMDNKDLAKKHYDEARSILESKIKERPEDARFHSSLAIAYAGLGRKEDAMREGKLAVELQPLNKEAMRRTHRIEDLARIYVMVGEHDKAINQLEDLLSIPGPFSIPLLQLDPAWAPLRDHPRFKKLVEAGK